MPHDFHKLHNDGLKGKMSVDCGVVRVVEFEKKKQIVAILDSLPSLISWKITFCLDLRQFSSLETLYNFFGVFDKS